MKKQIKIKDTYVYIAKWNSLFQKKMKKKTYSLYIMGRVRVVNWGVTGQP